MIRIVLLNLVLLLLPTVLYVAYTHLTAPDDTADSLEGVMQAAPMPWLLMAGALLALTVMLIFGTPPQGRPGEKYTPPIFRDGKIIPGHLDKEKTETDDAAKTE